MNKTITFLILIAACGGLFLLFAKDQSTTAPVPGHQKQTAQVGSRLERVDGPDVGPSTPSLVSALDATTDYVSPSKKLAAEFMKSTDLRSFAIAARSRPAEGGYFYAMYAATLCGSQFATDSQTAIKSIRNLATKAGTVSPLMIAISEKYVARCALFASGEAERLRQDVLTESKNRRDPLVNASEDFDSAFKSRNPDAVKSALQVALKLGDFTLVDSPRPLLELAMSFDAGSGNRAKGDLWFGGKLYNAFEDPIPYSILKIALTIATCTGQTPCQAENSMMLSCLGGQICTDNVTEMLRQQSSGPGGLDDDQFASAQVLSVRIREAISNGNVNAFVH